MDGNQGDNPAGVNMNSSLGSPSLTDWARIMDFCKDRDQKMVDSYNLNKNINSVLVLAGVLSLVLAFLLRSSTVDLLPVDSSQSTVDLLAQLVALHIGNSSNRSTAQSAQFTPSSSSVLINSLWYSSLFMSLGSVFFGLMAKQWLHAHMQRTTMSTEPADAVLLRQLRHKAFVDWKTPAVLACMLVLLKVAVALFYAGVAVQLVTLDVIIGCVCVVPVAIMFALAMLSLIPPGPALHS